MDSNNSHRGKDDTRSAIKLSCTGCKMGKILVKHKRKMNERKKERRMEGNIGKCHSAGDTFIFVQPCICPAGIPEGEEDMLRR